MLESEGLALVDDVTYEANAPRLRKPKIKSTKQFTHHTTKLNFANTLE